MTLVIKRSPARFRNPVKFLAIAILLMFWAKVLVGNRVVKRDGTHSTMHKLNDVGGDGKPFVAIVSCITSNTDRFMYKTDQLLREKLLPSIHNTISDEELAKYRVEVILGYDEGDPYWEQQSNQEVVITNLDDSLNHIPLTFISLKKDSGRPNHIPFNELCQTAYNQGVQYLVRINDDTHFITQGWLTLAINTLQSFSPPNVGVVGPKCKGDASEQRQILTHDMTYLPYHLAIFGTYYPDVFDNYYLDDWISKVYAEKRTKQLDGWEVVHNTQAFGTRYTPSFDQDRYLDEEVERGKRLVESFIDAMAFKSVNKVLPYLR